MLNSKSFLVVHGLLPMLGLLLISIYISAADLDRSIADYFYSIQGNSWAWKETWIAAYFFGVHYQSRWRWPGLVIPLLVGVVLGVVQQIRGAHFISHDLWSLAVCWFFSLVVFMAFFSSSVKKGDVRGLVCQ